MNTADRIRITGEKPETDAAVGEESIAESTARTIEETAAESAAPCGSGEALRAGIDIGSTTVKLVILDGNGRVLFAECQRHHARTREAAAELLHQAARQLGDRRLAVHLTGSGALGLSGLLSIPFVQEVAAVAEAIGQKAPQTDAAIELGGEDAKIIYFRGRAGRADERGLRRGNRLFHRPDGLPAAD